MPSHLSSSSSSPPSSPDAPLLVARDGVGYAVGDGGLLFACGGAPFPGESVADAAVATSFERVLVYNANNGRWDCIDCHGDVPLPRHHHTVSYYKGRLIVCGGELLPQSGGSSAAADEPLDDSEEGVGATSIHFDKQRPSSNGASVWRGALPIGSDDGGAPRRVPYTTEGARRMRVYVLAIESGEWAAYACAGEQPLDRCSHTATIIGNTLLVVGGKPPLALPLPSQRRQPKKEGSGALRAELYLANSSLLGLKKEGFFDVHILHLGAMVWQRLHPRERTGTLAAPMRAPMLWGHSAVYLPDSNSGMLLLIGGMDVAMAGEVAAVHGSAADAVPEAHPNASVFSLDVRLMIWSRIQTAFPPHSPFADGGEEGAWGGQRGRARRGGMAEGWASMVAPPPCVDQSAVAIPNTADEVLVCGGFAVGLGPHSHHSPDGGSRGQEGSGGGGSDSHLYPHTYGEGAALRPNSEVHVFSVRTLQWRRVQCPDTHVLRGRLLLGAVGEGRRAAGESAPMPQHLVLLRATSEAFVLDCRVEPRVQGWRRVGSAPSSALRSLRRALVERHGGGPSGSSGHHQTRQQEFHSPLPHHSAALPYTPQHGEGNGVGPHNRQYPLVHVTDVVQSAHRPHRQQQHQHQRQQQQQQQQHHQGEVEKGSAHSPHTVLYAEVPLRGSDQSIVPEAAPVSASPHHRHYHHPSEASVHGVTLQSRGTHFYGGPSADAAEEEGKDGADGDEVPVVDYSPFAARYGPAPAASMRYAANSAYTYSPPAKDRHHEQRGGSVSARIVEGQSATAAKRGDAQRLKLGDGGDDADSWPLHSARRSASPPGGDFYTRRSNGNDPSFASIPSSHHNNGRYADGRRGLSSHEAEGHTSRRRRGANADKHRAGRGRSHSSGAASDSSIDSSSSGSSDYDGYPRRYTEGYMRGRHRRRADRSLSPSADAPARRGGGRESRGVDAFTATDGDPYGATNASSVPDRDRRRRAAVDRHQRLVELQAEAEALVERSATDEAVAALRMMRREVRRAEKLLAIAEEARSIAVLKGEADRGHRRRHSRSGD